MRGLNAERAGSCCGKNQLGRHDFGVNPFEFVIEAQRIRHWGLAIAHGAVIPSTPASRSLRTNSFATRGAIAWILY